MEEEIVLGFREGRLPIILLKVPPSVAELWSKSFENESNPADQFLGEIEFVENSKSRTEPQHAAGGGGSYTAWPFALNPQAWENAYLTTKDASGKPLRYRASRSSTVQKTRVIAEKGSKVPLLEGECIVSFSLQPVSLSDPKYLTEIKARADAAEKKNFGLESMNVAQVLQAEENTRKRNETQIAATQAVSKKAKITYEKQEFVDKLLELFRQRDAVTKEFRKNISKKELFEHFPNGNETELAGYLLQVCEIDNARAGSYKLRPEYIFSTL